MPDLPSGTVTFLFTDVEGSTKLLRKLGAAEYAEALAEHRRILRGAFGTNGGVEVDTQGDAFFVAFPTAPGALRAAAEALAGLAVGPIRVRMGIHTGTPHLAEEGYVGADVHRAARIAACGHGGQVLVSAATAALLGTAEGLRDLGEHRLKDLQEPEWLYQLGDEEFAPLKSLNNTNLPAAANPLVGRERELAELTDLLRNEEIRLLTLTGAGGAGKTRLALELAADLAGNYPNGVFFVSLAPISDPSLVLPAIAQTLGFKEAAGEPLLETLAHELEPKRMLLFLDNLEQVAEAAGELAQLLERAPQLSLLVTSREPLHLAAECEYDLPPLLEPEAVELFRARAARSKPAEAVAEICRRLDGLPLAIELAAARTKVLPPQKLLERLEQRLPLLAGKRRDVPARQQTLRATIAWSYDLLSPEEQRVFGRLAVFVGGCTLETAEAVCEAELETLESLIEKSLLRQDEDAEGDPRYWMLETIREYGAGLLDRFEEAAELRSRHAGWFLRLAKEAAPALAGESQALWFDKLEREHGNLRAALENLREAAKTTDELSLATHLASFWEVHGHLKEGTERLSGILGRAHDAPAERRAQALLALSPLLFGQGRSAQSRTAAEEALRLFENAGDRQAAALCLRELGNAERYEGRAKRAVEFWDRSAGLFREAGDDHGAAMILNNIGELAVHERDYVRGAALLGEGREIFRRLGDEWAVALTDHNLGLAALGTGDLAEAFRCFSESLKRARDLGSIQVIADGLLGMAAATCRGDAPRAVRLVSAADALLASIGTSPQPLESQVREEALTVLRTELDVESFAEEWQAGAGATAEDAVQLALSQASPTRTRRS